MSAPMSTHDCRNGHHGASCGMTPCSCECHAAPLPAEDTRAVDDGPPWTCCGVSIACDYPACWEA